MKTLVFAALCFLLLLWGCYDVASFRRQRRVAKRSLKVVPPPDRLPTAPAAAEPQGYDRPMVRRQR